MSFIYRTEILGSKDKFTELDLEALRDELGDLERRQPMIGGGHGTPRLPDDTAQVDPR